MVKETKPVVPVEIVDEIKEDIADGVRFHQLELPHGFVFWTYDTDKTSIEEINNVLEQNNRADDLKAGEATGTATGEVIEVRFTIKCDTDKYPERVVEYGEEE